MAEEKEYEQTLESLDKGFSHSFVKDKDSEFGGIWYPVVNPRQFAAMCSRNPSQINNRMRVLGKDGNPILTIIRPFDYGSYQGPEMIVLDKKALDYKAKCLRMDKRNGRSV